ncbi:MAG: hypothetical protein HZC28_01800 [Spirochaetes bacterium]|nr:hypothetical protein [Spirochaetota bacterium]
MLRCFNCGREIPAKEKVMRGDVCPHCDRDVRVCRNCRFYEKGRHNDCTESAAELIRDKEHTNMCDFFMARNSASSSRPTSAENKTGGLFKNGDTRQEKKGPLFKE